MLWFMSYVWRHPSIDDDPTFGCCTSNEWPIAKVKRWNDIHKDRVTVLLSWCEIPNDSSNEIDVEI